MDLQVWSQLSDADQQFLSSLIHQLPALLDEIKASGVSIKRGWDQWHQLANDIRRMLDICTASVMDEDELFVSPKPTKSRSRRKSQS